MAEILVDFRGSGYIQIFVEEGETIEDLGKLSNEELVGRILEFSDLLDLIDDNNIEVDDITASKD